MTLAEFLAVHLLVTIGIERVGVLFWRVFRIQSPKERLRVVIWAPLMLGGYFVGGCVFWGLKSSLPYFEVAQGGALGMVSGQVFGLFISWFLWKYYRREIESEDAG